MFERFTDRARKVMALANQEAQRLNHEHLGTEHILLGVVREGSGVGANVLKNLKVELVDVRRAIEAKLKAGTDIVTMGKLPQTEQAKNVAKAAIAAAQDLGHNYVGTEHLLLGLLSDPEFLSARVLVGFGLTAERVRDEALALIGLPEKTSPHTRIVLAAMRLLAAHKEMVAAEREISAAIEGATP